jgi:branched-chain amino acid transport system substrate-binding protein
MDMTRIQYLALTVVVLLSGAAQGQTSVKIGVLNDMSGLYADSSGPGAVAAARLAVEDFGAAKKDINVEIVSADHQNKPDVGASIARAWFDDAKVDVIVDVPNTAVALAVNEIAREKNKVLLVSSGGSSELTGPKCSPNTIHWTYDTWSLANGIGKITVKTGGDTWFFITADYAFGHALERDTASVVEANGGKVIGKVRVPLNTSDFSSFLLQAQQSQAKVIALANGGGDTINSIKQAAEFGILGGAQNVAGLQVLITDVHALGLRTAQGLIFTEAFYWDRTDEGRAFAKRFAPLYKGNMPTQLQAGVYAAVLHYLKAVAALKGSADGKAVVAKMKETPTDDPLFGKGGIRADGRKIHNMYLFEVKKPAESGGPWDYYKLRATIPATEAFRPLKEGHCPLVSG